MAGPSAIRFILNDDQVVLEQLDARQTLLDFLRLDKRLRGSKEGCAEGDCGACTVLVGRLKGPELVYESVTACITFTASLHGAHVVTIEQLSKPGELLHPIQQAMVEHHGSQCGFCTPGIVMSLYGLWLKEEHPSTAQVETALQGNLCRCTGYAPIVRAGKAMSSFGDRAHDRLANERESIRQRLLALQTDETIELGDGRDRVIIPKSVEALAEAYAANPTGTIVAGSTDVGLWVTKFMRDIGPIIFTGQVQELHRIEEGCEALRIGAGATYTETSGAIDRHFPQLSELWHRIGGEQVRNMGTVGGNIANGSPIGDTPPALMALGASITLRRGDERRDCQLDDYFLAYGKQDRAEGEFVESITIPYLPPTDRLAVYKVSKRREEDISSLCGAFRVGVDSSGSVDQVRIAFGGMAATPRRARAVEARLTGRPWSVETIEAAIPAFAEDYQPISDMRASAEYRLLAAQNLLRRFFLETTGAGQRLMRGAA